MKDPLDDGSLKFTVNFLLEAKDSPPRFHLHISMGKTQNQGNSIVRVRYLAHLSIHDDSGDFESTTFLLRCNVLFVS